MNIKGDVYSRLFPFPQYFAVKLCFIQNIKIIFLYVTKYLNLRCAYMIYSNSLCMFRRFLLAKTDTPPDVKPRYTS